ncbi:hypothetical protein D9C73_028486 [Collichthys lucidus]|uniref:Uncharacterized protein n=1 Tax=Collichthys lucidus TaxID=240159 RepID=A0A4U5TUI7_COLLU|nr:hypothetical protein D9C73_028486 [Collichthys lucidus]
MADKGCVCLSPRTDVISVLGEALEERVFGLPDVLQSADTQSAERHQLLQAYLGAGSLFPPDIHIEKGTEFYASDYNESMKSYTEMSALMEDIREALLAVLPSLPEDKVQSLLNKLASIGVESKSDLQFIKEEDLPANITPIQCRRLLNAWQTQDQTSYVFFVLQVFSTAADVERTKPLPESPRLIVLGDVLTATNWMLSIEGLVTVGPHQNIVPGMAALFSCYYVFNLVYQEEASSTLEFIQRCFIGINPTSGTKTTKWISPRSGKMKMFKEKIRRHRLSRITSLLQQAQCRSKYEVLGGLLAEK